MTQLQNSSLNTARVALLHQPIDSPIVNGVRKPMKPGDMTSLRKIPSTLS
jgi:hypothetical protein